MRNQQISLRLQYAGLIGALALLVGCSTVSPTIDTGPDAEVTFDGLHKVKGSRADEAWARPDADFSKYSRIMFRSAGIEYRPGGESGRTTYSRTHAEHFEITDRQKERLVEVVGEAFRKELAKSERFTFTDEAGPDVLLISGALLDVVSYVPPEPIGRGDIYLSRVGEATLVLEIRDSVSEAILARAIDRRAAEDAMDFSESNRVSNMAEVRRLANTWARLLRQRLDDIGGPAGS